MSLGYAQKLSYKEDVGSVGMKELHDPPNILQQKIEQLASMVAESKHLVVFTGAGISTSCGIPDFRGPKGVWTLQKEGKGVPDASLPFDRAMPSRTHMALVALEKAGILKLVISQAMSRVCVYLTSRAQLFFLLIELTWKQGMKNSQNVDSLHLRSGIPRAKLAELHGNSFREICQSCGTEYLRDFEIETIGLKVTPRRCSDEKCGAKLRDTVLDWEDALPPKEMSAAEKHCRMADVVLCLGTSLQITPACNLPLKCLRGGGEIAIVNLQPTPKDKRASLVIHGFVDKIISEIMNIINLRIPPYVRIDHFQVILTQGQSTGESKYAKWSLKVRSTHGDRAPLPFIKSVEVSFPERPELKSALLEKQLFTLKRETLRTRPLKIMLKINFNDGCACSFTSTEFFMNFQELTYEINQANDDVIQSLRNTAVRAQSCGQIVEVERNVLSSQKRISLYAVATNIVRYKSLSVSRISPPVNLKHRKLKKELDIKNNEWWMTRHADGGSLKKLKAY